MTCSHPSLAVSWWGAGQGASGQPSAPALLLARCPCQATAVTQTEVMECPPRAAKNCRVHQNTVPNHGKVVAHHSSYDVSPGRGPEIPLHSFHCLLTATPGTWPPSASCQATCPVWAGQRGRGKSLCMDSFRAKHAVLRTFPRGKSRVTDAKSVLFQFTFLWSLRWKMLVRSRNINISFHRGLGRRVSGPCPCFLL